MPYALWVIAILLSFGLTYFLSQGLSAKKRTLLLVSIPLCALGIYLIVGKPELESRPQAELLETHRFNPYALTAWIENKLSQNPNDYQGWHTLGRTYFLLGNFYQAEEAYLRADKIKPNQSATLVGLIETKFFSAQEFINEDNVRLIKRALKVDRNNLPALLWLAKGLEQDGKKNQAIVQLRRAQSIAQKQKNKKLLDHIKERLDKIAK
jgi:cytochrome c-type biogenesis protein CcmH